MSFCGILNQHRRAAKSLSSKGWSTTARSKARHEPKRREDQRVEPRSLPLRPDHRCALGRMRQRIQRRLHRRQLTASRPSTCGGTADLCTGKRGSCPRPSSSRRKRPAEDAGKLALCLIPPASPGPGVEATVRGRGCRKTCLGAVASRAVRVAGARKSGVGGHVLRDAESSQCGSQARGGIRRNQ